MLRVISFLSLAAILLAGCGSGPRLTKVEGVVLLNGQPAKNIEVEFWPEVEGPRSLGLTDDEGKFALALDDKSRQGAVPGTHKVVLRDWEVLQGKMLGRAADETDMTEGRVSRISEIYRDPLRTPLSVEVKEGGEPIELVAEPNQQVRQVSAFRR